MREQRHPDDTMRWVRRGSALAVLVIGWIFILVTNHFHITPPVVFVGLGYFAAVAAIYTLYRTGSTAVTENDEADDALSWERPLGALDELEREKRALLKAIKEAEFDQQMGKLSKADADAMIGIYRARAIEVIKEIDLQNSTSGKVGTVRDRILREARARIHIEEKAAEAVPAGKKKKDKGAEKQKARADKLADAVNAVKKAEPEAKAEAVEAKAEEAAKVEEAKADAVEEPKAEEAKAEEAKADSPDLPVEASTSRDDQSESKEAAR